MPIIGNLFIYQARESRAWSQQGFWQPIFCTESAEWTESSESTEIIENTESTRTIESPESIRNKYFSVLLSTFENFWLLLGSFG